MIDTAIAASKSSAEAPAALSRSARFRRCDGSGTVAAVKVAGPAGSEADTDTGTGVGRGHLCPNRPQRQVIIPLKGQHSAEAVDVRDGVFSVPRCRTDGENQLLFFQKTQL